MLEYAPRYPGLPRQNIASPHKNPHRCGLGRKKSIFFGGESPPHLVPSCQFPPNIALGKKPPGLSRHSTSIFKKLSLRTTCDHYSPNFMSPTFSPWGIFKQPWWDELGRRSPITTRIGIGIWRAPRPDQNPVLTRFKSGLYLPRGIPPYADFKKSFKVWGSNWEKSLNVVKQWMLVLGLLLTLIAENNF